MKQNNQLVFEEVEKIPKNRKGEWQKQKWRNALQEYCNQRANSTGNFTGYCVCGYMKYCDYCRDVGCKNACVKAICRYIREENINIKLDYNDYNFRKLLWQLEGR